MAKYQNYPYSSKELQELICVFKLNHLVLKTAMVLTLTGSSSFLLPDA